MMSEISLSSISAPGISRDLLGKPYKNSYSFISENSSFMKHEVENKEVNYLKKTVNRLEQNMDFMQHEHCQMLEGLQKQIEKLREENQDLQFQLVMRSDRHKDPDNKNLAKSKDLNVINPKFVTDQLLHLKQALDEEKRKNKELLEQLESVQSKNDDEVAKENDSKLEISEPSLSTEDSVFIAPDIRITLNPLALATYQQDSGLYIMKTPLTVQDCEMVIQKLLQKIDNTQTTRDNSSSNRSLSGNQRVKMVPGIKKPLQPIKPISRGSSNLKLNAINGSQPAKVIGMPSTQKLLPILTQKPEPTKLEQDSQRLNVSRRSEREYKPQDNSQTYIEGKTGSSLPALPKPNDYNQADKQRRLHLLQRKRLDQYNNRS